MADPIDRENLKWEEQMATISLAGVRPLLTDKISAAGTSQQTYTIDNLQTKRVVIVHESSGDLDIRFDLNAAATATDFPVLAGAYFVLEVEKGDVLHFFNTTGSGVDIHLMEIR